MNNADVGMTIQKLICDEYNLIPNEHAQAQFNSSYNKSLETDLKILIKNIFEEINDSPVKCTTYEFSSKAKETLSPHNFILKSGKTLSIRTNKKGDKVAPRVVGQCGLEKFNEHFSSICGYEIENKEEIKNVVYQNIHLMLPIFIDYLFISDYTVFINIANDSYKYYIIDSEKVLDIELNRSNFSFTRSLVDWNESNTLKYNSQSIAEIQIHKNRTFKCRFIMSAVLSLIEEQKINSETLGITAEKTICDIYSLEYPKNFLKRYSKKLQSILTPTIKDAFKFLPVPIKHTGSDKGVRGGESKCSYDFLLDKNMELSLKTNTGKMVCPPEVGQPSAKTCYLYFQDYIDEDHIDSDIFKQMILSNISEVFPVYINHLFDSDYLLWIYKKSNIFTYKIFKKGFANNINFDSSKFSFTKSTLDEWKESNTLKYDGISIGEFQVHKARDCYKFRFNLENFSKLVEDMKND